MHHGNTRLHSASDKVEEAATLLTRTRASSACRIDSFEAHTGFPAGLEESSKIFAINRNAGQGAACRLYSIERVDRLEESIHWLLSAITLIYLILAIIGL